MTNNTKYIILHVCFGFKLSVLELGGYMPNTNFENWGKK